MRFGAHPMTAPTKRVPRRIVQVAVSNHSTRVLADDGSLWGWNDDGWKQWPALPDREVPADDEVPF